RFERTTEVYPQSNVVGPGLYELFPFPPSPFRLAPDHKSKCEGDLCPGIGWINLQHLFKVEDRLVHQAVFELDPPEKKIYLRVDGRQSQRRREIPERLAGAPQRMERSSLEGKVIPSRFYLIQKDRRDGTELIAIQPFEICPE